MLRATRAGETRHVWVEDWNVKTPKGIVRMRSFPVLDLYRRYASGELTREEFARAADALSLNVGPVIDEAALIRALQSGRIRGAALDVFEVEPLPSDSPLYGMENVLLSPHSADHTATWLDEAMQFFIDNFKRFASGQALVNVVDKRAGY